MNNEKKPSDTELLKTIEWRLEETIAAFTVQLIISENCNKNPALHKVINDWNGFWKPISIGLETTIIIGIIAIIETGSNNATLLQVYNNLKKNGKLSPSFPQNFDNDLNTISKRYVKFRNKIFGHNDTKRDGFVNEFSNAGFTYETIGQDLNALKYALKVLSHANGGGTIPDKNSAKNMFNFSDLYIAHTKEHCSGFLAKLAAVAPDFLNDTKNSNSNFLQWLLQ